jgi:methyl-accepting chemotaxis protein
LYSNDENALAKMINDALKKQIQEIAATASHISLQNDLLKKELSTKAEDFEKISSAIERCFSENLLKLNENTQSLLEEYKKAAETSENFSSKVEELKQGALSLTN